MRKLQSTSDLNHFHARDLPYSHVKSRDDPISDCRVDSAVPYSFIYTDSYLSLSAVVIVVSSSFIIIIITIIMTISIKTTIIIITNEG